MKIGLRGGHSNNCEGANGVKNEYYTMQKLYNIVYDILVNNGHEVVNCNSHAYSQHGELSEGSCKSNDNNVDLFLSLHMNCSDGEGHGVECWTYGENARANVYAHRIVNNLATIGLYNRGVRFNKNYYEMIHIKAPNIIVETAFCDNSADCSIVDNIGLDKIGLLICQGIDPNIQGSLTINSGSTSGELIPNGDVGKVYTVTAHSGLNVRSGRGTDYPIMGTLSPGEKIELWYCLNGWASIGYGGKTGFIYTKYLSL